MLTFLGIRLGRMIIVLWGVVTLVFGLSRLSGDPVALMVPEGTPPADIERLRHEMGFDAPLIVQYGRFWSDVAHGDLGQSIIYRTSALDVALSRLPATGQLALVAMAVALAVGVTVGVLTATRPSGRANRLASAPAMTGQATPAFVFGILLILVLSVQFRLLPTGGRGEWNQLIMPGATLAFSAIPTLLRITRSGVADTLRRDYIRTARAKGLPSSIILWRHALRNAALPIVTIAGIQFGSLLGGAAIVETLFAWPGVGQLAIDAINRRDYPVVQTVLLLSAFWFVVLNMVVDIGYALIDPRTRMR